MYERIYKLLVEGSGPRIKLRFKPTNFKYGPDSEFKFVKMNPKTFLSHTPNSPTPEFFKAKGDQNSLRVLTNRLKTKQKIDPGFLRVDRNRKITGHEGRHRATASHGVGLKSIPVGLTLGRYKDFGSGEGKKLNKKLFKLLVKHYRDTGQKYRLKKGRNAFG